MDYSEEDSAQAEALITDILAEEQIVETPTADLVISDIQENAVFFNEEIDLLDSYGFSVPTLRVGSDHLIPMSITEPLLKNL